MKSFKQHLNESSMSARNWKEYHLMNGTDFVKPKVKLRKLPTKNVTKADLIYGQMIQAKLEAYRYSDSTLMPGATRKSNAWEKKRDKMHVAYAQENDMSTSHNGLDVANLATALTDNGVIRRDFRGKETRFGGSNEYMLNKKEWTSSRQKKDYEVWLAEQEKIYPEQF